jgi:hypothetical protein
MRASEVMKKHNAESRRLEEERSKKEQEILSAVRTTPAGRSSLESGAPVFTTSEHLLALYEEYESLVQRIADHHLNSPDLIRDYRVVDLDTDEDLASFRVSYELAPLEARKRSPKPTGYKILESDDGVWIDYDLPRDAR